MKTIEKFETARETGRSLKELGINPTLYRAYMSSEDAGNELIDFNDVIWDNDVETISETLKAEGITEFTISSTFSSLIETLAEFEKRGYKMSGLTNVKAPYMDFRTGENKIIPAIKMTL